MRTTEDIIEEALSATGWNSHSLANILTEYIKNQDSNEAFADFISQAVEIETEPKQVETRNAYHFSIGNSSVGPIGYCAEIWADQPEQAVALLQKYLPLDFEISLYDEHGDLLEGNQCLCVYFNENAITEADIEEVTSLEDDTYNYSLSP